MYIYLMRHGQTDWNLVHRMQGHSDIPLNRTGLRQAREAAAAMEDLPIDRILTSPLRRAKQTAQAVAAGRGVPVLTEELLVEMSFGGLEGVEMNRRAECAVLFDHPEQYVPLPGGESYDELLERGQTLLERVLKPLEGRYHDVLCCSHGAMIRGVVVGLKGYKREAFWKDPPQPNCSCTVLECVNGRFSLVEEGRGYAPGK